MESFGVVAFLFDRQEGIAITGIWWSVSLLVCSLHILTNKG